MVKTGDLLFNSILYLSKDYDINEVPFDNQLNNNPQFGLSWHQYRQRMNQKRFEELTEINMDVSEIFYNMAKENYINYESSIHNNKVWLEILKNDEDIAKRINKMKQKYPNDTEFKQQLNKNPNITKIAKISIIENKENNTTNYRILWDKQFLKDNNLSLTDRDAVELTKVIRILGKKYQHGENIYIDSRLIPGYFGFSNNLFDTSKDSPETFKLKKGFETIARGLTKESRNNTIIRNPSLVLKNYISNLLGLVAMGIPMKSVFGSIGTYTRELENYLATLRKVNRLKSDLYSFTKNISVEFYDNKKFVEDDKNKKRIQKEIEILQQQLENNLIHPIFKEGLYTNIVEDSEEDTTQNQLDQKVINKIIKLFNLNKNGNTEKYMHELGLTSKSDLYNSLARWARYGDIIPRVILYYDLLSKGMNHKEAIDYAQDTFVNYNTPIYSSLIRKYDYYGFGNYIKYFIGIQRTIWNIIKDKPSRAIGYFILQAWLNSDYLTTFLGENILMRGFPSSLYGNLMNVVRWNNMTNI